MSLIEISRQAFDCVHINSLCKIAQTEKFKKRAFDFDEDVLVSRNKTAQNVRTNANVASWLF